MHTHQRRSLVDHLFCLASFGRSVSTMSVGPRTMFPLDNRGPARGAAPLYAEQGTDNPRLCQMEFWPRTQARPGPTTMLERFQWARKVWDGLTSDERDRLIRNLRKLETSSHFTGLGSFELILHRIISEVNEHCVSGIPDNRSRHCCDHDTSRQRVLTSYHKCHRPHHVHSDIFDRLTDEQKATINSMKPHERPMSTSASTCLRFPTSAT